MARTSRLARLTGLFLATSLLGATGCGNDGGDASQGAAAGDAKPAGQTYVIGVIAKSESNPVFKAARKGARDAAERLGAEHDVTIQIRWQTPPDEDAQRQAQYVEQLISAGVDGIAVSCSDSNLLTDVLADAVDRNIAVVTFDSDAPDSGRMCYYGVDDVAAGREVMNQLARVMGESGTVAVLAGNQAAANLQARVQGVREAADAFPGIEILDVFYHPEQATDAAARMQQVQNANPQITGWALVGGWPLYTDNALDGIYQSSKIVSMDPLPLPLEYVKAGQVQVLVGQPYYGWGERSVELIFDKIHFDRSPTSEFIYAEFDIVDGGNAEQFTEQWNTWLSDD